MLALSGFRPVADVWTPQVEAGATLDTLGLYGFDSPQFTRTMRFMIEEIDEPPLLSPAAVALGDRLYALNIRADGLRIDEYDRTGTLQRAWVDPTAGDTQYFPVDLAARETAEGVEFAVLVGRPQGRVVFYSALSEE